jgi:hypothetical protein
MQRFLFETSIIAVSPGLFLGGRKPPLTQGDADFNRTYRCKGNEC